MNTAAASMREEKAGVPFGGWRKTRRVRGRGGGAAAAETAREGELRRQRGEAGRRHGSGGAVAGVGSPRGFGLSGERRCGWLTGDATPRHPFPPPLRWRRIITRIRFGATETCPNSELKAAVGCLSSPSEQ
jgi:hypothetical protein